MTASGRGGAASAPSALRGQGTGRDVTSSTSLPPRLGDWWGEAACLSMDPAIFYPENGSNREALGICATCAVREECLDYALWRPEPFGVWGGASERQRKRLRHSGAREYFRAAMDRHARRTG